MFKNIFHKLINLSGYEVHRIPNAKDKINENNKAWNRIGNTSLPQIETLIDIGVGITGTPYLWKHFSNVQFVFVDPVEECRKSVESYLSYDGNYFLPIALGMQEDIAYVNVAEDINKSSLLNRGASEGYNKVSEKREVEVKSLDSALEALKIKPPYGLKIDTEGYELEVLRGSIATLEITSFIVAEVRYRKNFTNTYTFYELMSFLYDRSFVPYDIIGKPDDRKMDMVFIKKGNDVKFCSE